MTRTSRDADPFVPTEMERELAVLLAVAPSAEMLPRVRRRIVQEPRVSAWRVVLAVAATAAAIALATSALVLQQNRAEDGQTAGSDSALLSRLVAKSGPRTTTEVSTKTAAPSRPMVREEHASQKHVDSVVVISTDEVAAYRRVVREHVAAPVMNRSSVLSRDDKIELVAIELSALAELDDITIDALTFEHVNPGVK